eukprot:GEMP01005710.1.p1 GENE.GEMP01005710.1~~GEMP01005710.1.p1  ORF type:complete len:671 (+),score=115.65 GEMP01005710.1:824-2836(+)
MTARVEYLRNATDRSQDVMTKVSEVCNTVSTEPITLDRFGSRVYGVFLPMSDADLVMHLKEENEPGKELLQQITDHLKGLDGFTAVKNVPVKSTLNFTYLSMKVDLTFVAPGKEHSPTIFTNRVTVLLNDCDIILQHAFAFNRIHIVDPCRAFCLLVVDWAKGNDICYRKGSIGTKMKAVHWVLLACTFVMFTEKGQMAGSTTIEDYLKLFFQFVTFFPFGTHELCPFADDDRACIVARQSRKEKLSPMYIQGLHDDNLVYHVDQTAKALAVQKAAAARDEVHKAEFYDNWKNTNWQEEGEWKRNDNPDAKAKWVFEKKVQQVAGASSPVSTRDSSNATPDEPQQPSNEQAVGPENARPAKPKPVQRPPPKNRAYDADPKCNNRTPHHNTDAERPKGWTGNPHTIATTVYVKKAPAHAPTVSKSSAVKHIQATSAMMPRSLAMPSSTQDAPSTPRPSDINKHCKPSDLCVPGSSTPNISSQFGSPNEIAVNVAAELSCHDDDHQNGCHAALASSFPSHPMASAANGSLKRMRNEDSTLTSKDSLKRMRNEDRTPTSKVVSTPGAGATLSSAALVKGPMDRALARWVIGAPAVHTPVPTLLESTVASDHPLAKATLDPKTTQGARPTPCAANDTATTKDNPAEKRDPHLMASRLGLTEYVSSPSTDESVTI